MLNLARGGFQNPFASMLGPAKARADVSAAATYPAVLKRALERAPSPVVSGLPVVTQTQDDDTSQDDAYLRGSPLRDFLAALARGRDGFETRPCRHRQGAAPPRAAGGPRRRRGAARSPAKETRRPCDFRTAAAGRGAAAVDIPWKRVAATPRRRRGYSAEIIRGGAAAATMVGGRRATGTA